MWAYRETPKTFFCNYNLLYPCIYKLVFLFFLALVHLCQKRYICLRKFIFYKMPNLPTQQSLYIYIYYCCFFLPSTQSEQTSRNWIYSHHSLRWCVWSQEHILTVSLCLFLFIFYLSTCQVCASFSNWSTGPR